MKNAIRKDIHVFGALLGAPRMGISVLYVPLQSRIVCHVIRLRSAAFAVLRVTHPMDRTARYVPLQFQIARHVTRPQSDVSSVLPDILQASINASSVLQQFRTARHVIKHRSDARNARMGTMLMGMDHVAYAMRHMNIVFLARQQDAASVPMDIVSTTDLAHLRISNIVRHVLMM